MPSFQVYLKCEQDIETTKDDVFLKDVGTIWCSDKDIRARLSALKIHHFRKEDPKRCVMDSVSLIQLMEENCPGIQVQLIGEPDVLIERVEPDMHKNFSHLLRCIFVCLISFFGTAFTIMAYHNDIGINEVFSEIYRLLMGREADGLNPLEISYSVGLAAGIILFFNHIGGRRITKDPTPIEVAMRMYEQDVNTTLIETASRKGWEQ